MFYHEIYHSVRLLVDDAADWVWGERPDIGPPRQAWSLEGAAGGALLRSRDARLVRRVRIGAYFTDEDIALALNITLSALIRYLWAAGEIEPLAPLRQELALQLMPTVNQLNEDIIYAYAGLPTNYMLPLSVVIREASTLTTISVLSPLSPWGALEQLYLRQKGPVAALGVAAPYMIDVPTVPQGGAAITVVLPSTPDITVALHYLREPVWFLGTRDLLNWDVLPRRHPDGFSRRFYEACIHGAAHILRSIDSGQPYPALEPLVASLVTSLRDEVIERSEEGVRT